MTEPTTSTLEGSMLGKFDTLQVEPQGVAPKAIVAKDQAPRRGRPPKRGQAKQTVKKPTEASMPPPDEAEDEEQNRLVRESMEAAKLATEQRVKAPDVVLLQSCGDAASKLIAQYAVKYGGQDQTWHLGLHDKRNLNLMTQREAHIVTQHPSSLTLGRPVMLGSCYLMAMPFERVRMERQAAVDASKARVNMIPDKAANKYVKEAEFSESTAFVQGTGKDGPPILAGSKR